MLTIVLPFIVIPHIKLNASYRKLSNLPSPLMSLTPYIKDLEWDLYDENVEDRKEKDVVRFSDIVDLLANTSLPSVWPLSGLDPKPPYSFSYRRPYPNFLQLNSNSPALYLPYFNHNDIQICVKEGYCYDSFLSSFLHLFSWLARATNTRLSFPFHITFMFPFLSWSVRRWLVYATNTLLSFPFRTTLMFPFWSWSVHHRSYYLNPTSLYLVP